MKRNTNHDDYDDLNSIREEELDYDNNGDSSTDDDAEFLRDVNRTKASYMAFSHVLSKQYILSKDTEYDDESERDSIEYREEMVLDLIEYKAVLCRDAIELAVAMQKNRRCRRCRTIITRKEKEISQFKTHHRPTKKRGRNTFGPSLKKKSKLSSSSMQFDMHHPSSMVGGFSNRLIHACSTPCQ